MEQILTKSIISVKNNILERNTGTKVQNYNGDVTKFITSQMNERKL